MFTDRSRPDDGATRYSMIWQNGQSWAGIETHMAYGAESAALARALGTASRRQPPPPPPKGSRSFTDAQATTRRTASGEPSPGQMYALQARKHTAVLRRAKPDITIEIRWCPSHKRAPSRQMGQAEPDPAEWNG